MSEDRIREVLTGAVSYRDTDTDTGVMGDCYDNNVLQHSKRMKGDE